ncbi:unnamed protein product [Calypogeia fissa]
MTRQSRELNADFFFSQQNENNPPVRFFADNKEGSILRCFVDSFMRLVGPRPAGVLRSAFSSSVAKNEGASAFVTDRETGRERSPAVVFQVLLHDSVSESAAESLWRKFFTIKAVDSLSNVRLYWEGYDRVYRRRRSGMKT